MVEERNCGSGGVGGGCTETRVCELLKELIKAFQKHHFQDCYIGLGPWLSGIALALHM